MGATAQIFPVIGAAPLVLPVPLPTQDVSDGTPGSAVPATAIQVAGSDGTNLQTLKTDSSGRQVVIGAAANGAAVTGPPVLMAGSDGTDARTIATDSGGQVKVLVENSPTVSGPTSTTANSPSAQTVTSTSGSILALNANRKECIVVNTGAVVVYLGLGQTPTSSAFHIALAACTTANDGTGGTYVSDMWKGAINAIVASTSGSVCVTELT